jgi:GTPase Era involved in 16S rRNA processing
MISISDRNRGKIVAEPATKLDNKRKFAIKALQFLTMICMNPKEDENFNEMLNIIQEATDKADRLYNPEGIKDECCATEFFDN